jgi:hypothetical protein
MAEIYMNAVFTLSATDGTRLGGAAPLRPFLSEAPKLKNALHEYTSLEKIYELLSETGNFSAREDGELDRRAWALQEKMLSRRLISLTGKDVFGTVFTTLHQEEGRVACLETSLLASGIRMTEPSSDFC